jgi:hypothetical protein
LLVLGLLSFIFSLVPPVSPHFVESQYADKLFPKISFIFGYVADSIPLAWFDIILIVAFAGFLQGIRRRKWLEMAAAIALAYLIFFWSWGINYHRESLQSRLVLNSDAMTNPAIERFTLRAAAELNALYPQLSRNPYTEEEIRSAAVARVARVVQRLDGTNWRAASRIKNSILINPWFRFAGIDGFFDPLVHEPIVNPAVLDIERPFIIAHELGHVRGYPDEGDANFVGLMATLMSDNPRLKYSGWMELWLYLRRRESDSLLDPGPRQDLQRIFDRVRTERIAWISNLQAAMLDLFLKANRVPEGVASYSRIVVLAAGTENNWDTFR